MEGALIQRSSSDIFSCLGGVLQSREGRVLPIEDDTRRYVSDHPRPNSLTRSMNHARVRQPELTLHAQHVSVRKVERKPTCSRDQMHVV